MLTLIKSHAKKRFFLLFLTFNIVLLSNFALAQTGLGIKIVVIDAGHGGKDPGAIGPNKTQEKDVVLSVALKLGNLIKENFPDVKVIYTRSTDVFIGLAKRAKIANEAGADLFISLHSNSAANSSAKGIESWVLGLHKTKAALEVAKFENSSILMEDDHDQTYQDFDPNDPDAYIALSLRQNAFLDQSIKFADLIQKECVGDLKRHNRGVKQAGFMVLYRATMPAVLVELGFLSNSEDEKFLASKDGQTKLAKEIYDAFARYKNSTDKVDSSLGGGSDVENSGGSSNQTTITDNSTSKEETNNESNPAETKGVNFRVQIATSSLKLETKPYNFKGMKDVELYISGKNIYKYSVGRYSTLEEAKQRQKEVKELGYTTAFIIAFEDEKRIDLQEAIKKTKK